MALKYITLKIDNEFSVDIIEENLDPSRPFHYEVYPTDDPENVIFEGMACTNDEAYEYAVNDICTHFLAEHLATPDA